MRKKIWLQTLKNQNKQWQLTHDQEKFIVQVLSYIQEIEPADLQINVLLKDKLGTNQRVDFVILNKEKGVHLAIKGQTKNHKQQQARSFTDQSQSELGIFLLNYIDQSWQDNVGYAQKEVRLVLLTQQLAHQEALTEKLIDIEEKFKLNYDLITLQLEIAKLKNDTKVTDELSQEAQNLKNTHLKIALKLNELKDEKGSLMLIKDELEKQIQHEHYKIKDNMNEVKVNSVESILQKKDLGLYDELISAQIGRFLGFTVQQSIAEFSQKNLINSINQLINNVNTNQAKQLVKIKKNYKIFSLLIFILVVVLVVTLIYFNVNKSIVNHDQRTDHSFQPAQSQNEPTKRIERELSKKEQPNNISTENKTTSSVISLNQPINRSDKQEELTQEVKSNLSFISSHHVSSYLGQEKKVCGRLAEIKLLQGRTHLNFDKKYPNNLLVATIFDRDALGFSGINQLLNKELCIQGTIQQYNNKYQIILKDPKQWLNSQ